MFGKKIYDCAKRAYEFSAGLVLDIFGMKEGYFGTRDVGGNLQGVSFDDKFNIDDFKKRNYEIENYKNEIDELTRRLVHDSIWHKLRESSLVERNSELERIAKGYEFKIEEDKKIISGLESNLELQRKAAGHLKDARKKADRRFSAGIERVYEMINRAVENGYNPLTNEENGRYAFVDRRGKVTAFSRKAQKIFGYEPGKITYSEIISGEDAAKIGSVKEEKLLKILPVKIAEGRIRLKDIKIIPIMFNDFYFGSVVDFEKIGRIEALREKIKERASRVISKSAEEIKRRITETGRKRELGFEG